MNAIVALCHFCEQHGPRVLFCTQPIHEEEPLQALMSSQASIPDPDVTALLNPDDLASLNRHSSWPLRNRSKSAMDSSMTSSVCSMDNNSLSGCESESTVSKERCEGCRSLQTDQPGYLSQDGEAKIRYVSCQQPHQTEVYKVLRQACIRSLSSEVCPGREGPIFFGDSNTQYVLSYTFHLKDTQSRGGKRLYSILVVMMDKIYLLNSWPFLVKHLRKVVNELQIKATTVYQKEEGENPTRPARLNNERSYALPTQVRLQRKTGSAVRALKNITADEDLFKSLHLSFTWILKACSSRLTEKLLEGPPTEDSIVDLEKKEEIVDDDFVLVPTEKVNPAPPEASHSFSTHNRNVEAAANYTLAEASTEEDDFVPIFTNLRDLFQMIGYHDFHQLAHHVMIGDQVIVQTDSHKMTASIIDCLQVLLPRGCCRVIYTSEDYLESWKCNFLGLSKFACLPQHVVDNEDYVIVFVEARNSGDKPLELSTSMLSTYRVQIITNKPDLARNTTPAPLEKMEKAMANLKLSWRVVEQSITCIKEEWMNKVKVLFTFTKAGGNRSEEETHKLLQVLGSAPEDRQTLLFWMTGLSRQYKNHMRNNTKHFQS